MTACKWNNEEELCFNLQKLYGGFGYQRYKMGKFEEYSLYLDNKNFLKSQSVITFNDHGGKLMALKPDVTLSIVKNAAPGQPRKVYYKESVYRPDKTTGEFREMVEKIGAIPVVVSPYEHDYAVAAISHVPHIIAAALVNNVKKLDSEKEYMHLLAAGGFKDITRIASSSADMWESIMFENKEDILTVLDSFSEVISDIRQAITSDDKKDVYDYFLNAQQYRNTFENATPKAFVKRYEIDVDVLDRPGSIAIIAVLFSSNGINIKNMGIVNSRESNSGALTFAFDSEEERQRSVELLRDMNYDVTVKE